MPLLSCSNARRDYLKPFGYGTLALPKASIQPLTMLARRGDRLTPIGPLVGTLRPGGVPLPSISRGRAANVSGAQSGSIDASIGLDILGAAIGALSGSTLGFRAAYKKASKVEFEFGDVFENGVDFTTLDAYLASAQAAPEIGPAVQNLLDDDGVFVIVATIDALQINVKASESSGADLSLQVPVIQQLVGGKIAVGSAAAGSSVLTYSSTEAPLAIGAQVVRLFFDGTDYKTSKLVKAGHSNLSITDAEGSISDEAPDILIEM